MPVTLPREGDWPLPLEIRFGNFFLGGYHYRIRILENLDFAAAQRDRVRAFTPATRVVRQEETR